MNIARIDERIGKLNGVDFIERVIVIGKRQGYLGLPVRVGIDADTGHGTMTSAWEPTPGELEAIVAGAKVHVQLLGHGAHPPILVTVGDAPGDDLPGDDELTGPALLAYRVEQAAGQLCRYGGAPACEAICDALEGLAELNDDLWNDRASELCVDDANNLKAAIDNVLRWREHRGKEPG